MQERSFTCKKDYLHARKIICMQELLFYMTYVRNDEPMSKLDFVCQGEICLHLLVYFR